jgi:hypothetical protein
VRTYPIVAAGVLLAACAIQKPAPLGPQPIAADLGPSLSAAEVRDEVVGNTGSGTRTGTTSKWSMYVAPDGRLASSSLQPPDTGRWRITDDGQFCATWQVTWDGREVCQRVHKQGIVMQFASPTSVEEMTFLPGNKL